MSYYLRLAVNSNVNEPKVAVPLPLFAKLCNEYSTVFAQDRVVKDRFSVSQKNPNKKACNALYVGVFHNKKLFLLRKLGLEFCYDFVFVGKL